MNITLTPSEYKALFRQLAVVVDQELTLLEMRLEKGTQTEYEKVVARLPILISSIHTIGFLRGQDGAFLSFRPAVDNQPEMYKVEYDFEKRLSSIITALLKLGFEERMSELLNRDFVVTWLKNNS